MAANMSIGILNNNYFVGRKALLDWVNSTFQLNYAKIEDCGTGALYCQIFDKIYYPTPSIPMSKVNFGAKHEYESVENFKLLQQAIDKVAAQHNVTPKAVPVAQLVRCKYQDNIEFLQWMYSFHNANCAGAAYDPIERRSKCKNANAAPTVRSAAPVTSSSAAHTEAGAGSGSAAAVGSSPAAKPKSSTSATGTGAGARRPAAGAAATATGTGTGAPGAGAKASVSPNRTGYTPYALAAADNAATAAAAARAGAGATVSAAKLAEMKARIQELEEVSVNVNKEREFYQQKVQEVEDVVAKAKAEGGEISPLLAKIIQVLEKNE